MSLFSSRQWWHTRLGSGEEFDQGSICVANIDNDPNGAVKIITGSFQGVLRVHQPHQQGYHIEDILLEAQLDSGILQVAAGNFLGGSSLCLAVLHPCKLSVYSLQAVGSSYLQLNKIYEHALEQTAANLAFGPFGGVKGVDHIVLQSYDGQLTFFEQEVQSFSRLLPDFLLPGPLAYVAASDSFVTSTASFELVAYRYNNIATAGWDVKQQAAAAAAAGGKRLQEDWRVVLGEAALDIQCGAVSSADTALSILVLAEHTFFVLDLAGHLLVQRRLDDHPSCFWLFPAPRNSVDGMSARDSSSSSSRARGAAELADNLLIATHSKVLQVYRGQQLAWAAQLELLPVAVRVTSIAGVRGLTVALDDTGNLAVLYLGTEPPRQTVAFAELRPLDYAAMEAERVALLARLKAAGGSAGLDAAAAAKAEAKAGGSHAPLLLRAKVPSRLDAAEMSSFGAGLGGSRGPAGLAGQRPQLTVTLQLTNTTKAPLQNLRIGVLTPQPIQACESDLGMPQLAPTQKGSAPAAVQLVLQGPCSSPGAPVWLPASSIAQVVVTYTMADGRTGVAQESIRLPLGLFCQVVPPVKTAEFKLTVNTNREPVQIAELFGDLLGQVSPTHADALSRAQGANMLSFRFAGGQDVSILVSKNGGRYRLQASCLEAMWLLLQELARRLTDHFAAADKKPPGAAAPAAAAGAGSHDAVQQAGEADGRAGYPAFQMTFDDTLPLQDLFHLIGQHFTARQTISSIDAQLEQQEITFRSIQKRLLVRYKDKNAAPLNQLDVLMEETYERITALADELAAAQERLVGAGQALGAGVQLLLCLAQLQFSLTAEELHLLGICLSPVVQDGSEVGWEEMTEAAMTQLLRSCLARTQKDAAAPVPPLTPASDTIRLQRHISLVFERLSKGLKLSGGSAQQLG